MRDGKDRRLVSAERLDRRLRLLFAEWARHRRARFFVAAVLLVIAVVLLWIFWPASAPRERHYGQTTACLLTGARGVASPEAAPVWAGMQKASMETLIKVQYLEVDGPQTPENAQTYLASLAMGKCDLVLTVGDAPVGALAQVAPRFPAVRFVSVGAAQGGVNVSTIDASGADVVQERVASLVADLPHGDS